MTAYEKDYYNALQTAKDLYRGARRIARTHECCDAWIPEYLSAARHFKERAVQAFIKHLRSELRKEIK